MFVLSLLILATPPREAAPMPRPVAIELTADVAKKLRTIAFQAAREGDLETLAAYFQAGQPVNGTNTRGDTLLTVAAYNAQAKAVALILKQPMVEVDAKNAMGLTALAAAAFKGQVETARQLVKAKADATAANDSGQTALMFAALAGRPAMVEYLLEAGADPRAKDDKGNTALSLATIQKAEEVVKILKAALVKP